MALWQGKTVKTYSPIQMMSPKTGHQKFKGLFHLTTTHFTLPSLLPSVSFHLPNPLFHIYHCCRLLVPPQLVIQTQISPTYPKILCSPRPLTSTLSNTARLCGSAPRRWNTNSRPTSDSKPKATSCGHPPMVHHTEGTFPLRICVCVTIKAVCRSVYGPWMCIPASLHDTERTSPSLTILKLHKCLFWQVTRSRCCSDLLKRHTIHHSWGSVYSVTHKKEDCFSSKRK